MKNQKNNILFVTNDLSGYGASLSLINLYNSIKSNYNCFFYVCGSSINQDISKDLTIISRGTFSSINVPCYHFRHMFTIFFWLLIKPISIIISTIRLCRVIKELNIDIIHTNVSIIISAFFAAKLCGKKHVWHLREFIYKDQGNYPLIGFYYLKKLINLSDYVIPISKEIQTFYNVKYNPIFNAVFSEKNISLEDNIKENYILFCGSLTVAKQPEHAIKIFSIISKEMPDIRLKIAGTGCLEERVRNLTMALGIYSKVDFLGYVKNPYSLFNKAKAFLMTSRYEALGRTTIEAMANNCVVIGYNSGGTSNIINNGKTGFLCNDINEFVLILKKVLKSSDNCEEIRTNARKWAIENCSEERYGKKIDDIYKKLIRQNDQ